MRNLIRKHKGAVLLLSLGILFLLLGIYQGGYRDAFQKAIRVCLECIGIG